MCGQEKIAQSGECHSIKRDGISWNNKKTEQVITRRSDLNRVGVAKLDSK